MAKNCVDIKFTFGQIKKIQMNNNVAPRLPVVHTGKCFLISSHSRWLCDRIMLIACICCLQVAKSLVDGDFCMTKEKEVPTKHNLT